MILAVLVGLVWYGFSLPEYEQYSSEPNCSIQYFCTEGCREMDLGWWSGGGSGSWCRCERGWALAADFEDRCEFSRPGDI